MSERIKVVVLGAAGRMGQTVVRAVEAAPDLELHAALDAGDDHMATRRRRVAVKGTRNIGPADLVHNNRLGHVDVDPETGMVSLDGDTVYSDPADSVPLSRLYFL